MNLWKRIFAGALALTLSAGILAGCNNSKTVNQLSGKPEKGQTVATIKVKDYGDIKVMLYPAVAPKGVENFVTHAKDGYYDGLKFHRVIEDFMAQGGDPEGTGMGGESIWGKPFETEYNGTLHNYTGALCYANSGKDTNGSQFYLVYTSPVDESLIQQMQAANDSYVENGAEPPYPTDETVLDNYMKFGGAPWLDNGNYTVFGQIYEGLDVLEKIMNCEKDPTELDSSGSPYVPSPDVVIETIEVSEYEG